MGECQAGFRKSEEATNSGLGCGDTQPPIPTFADSGHLKWHDNPGAQPPASNAIDFLVQDNRRSERGWRTERSFLLR
jgi:hypothetical protein